MALFLHKSKYVNVTLVSEIEVVDRSGSKRHTLHSLSRRKHYHIHSPDPCYTPVT